MLKFKQRVTGAETSSVALTIFYYVFRPLSPVMSGVRW
jgi:hypothetical protein